MREQIDRLTGAYNWERAAQEAGAEVEQLGNGTILIRKPVPLEENDVNNPVARTSGQRYTEEVVVTNMNLLLGSSLHEADGELVSRMVYKYNYLKEKDLWQPERMDYEEYGTNISTGSRYVSKTIYYYDNYSLKTN